MVRMILTTTIATVAMTGAAAAYDFLLPLGETAPPQVDQAYYGCGEYRLDVETIRTEANGIAVIWIRDRATILAAHPAGLPSPAFVGQGFRWTVTDHGSALFVSVLPSGEASDMRLECKLIGKPGDPGMPKWEERLRA